MFGLSKKDRENKLLLQTMEIIAKAFILEGYPADEASKIGLVTTDVLLKEIGEAQGGPWVLAVRGMFVLRNKLFKDKPRELLDISDKQLLDSLENVIIDALPRAQQDANEGKHREFDMMTLDSIERSIRDEYFDRLGETSPTQENEDGEPLNPKTGEPFKYRARF